MDKTTIKVCHFFPELSSQVIEKEKKKSVYNDDSKIDRRNHEQRTNSSPVP
jgi:hypothetical protein